MTQNKKTKEEIEKRFYEQFGMFFKDLPFEMGSQGKISYRGNMNEIAGPLLEFIYAIYLLGKLNGGKDENN